MSMQPWENVLCVWLRGAFHVAQKKIESVRNYETKIFWKNKTLDQSPLTAGTGIQCYFRELYLCSRKMGTLCGAWYRRWERWGRFSCRSMVRNMLYGWLRGAVQVIQNLRLWVEERRSPEPNSGLTLLLSFSLSPKRNEFGRCKGVVEGDGSAGGFFHGDARWENVLHVWFWGSSSNN